MTISKKSTVRPIIESMSIFIDEGDFYGCVAFFHKKLLLQKTKFPILEFVTREIFAEIPECHQIPVCDKIDSLGEMGSSVVTGIALQMRLEQHFNESINKSIEYVKNGDEWFHCDHIGERVLGHALLEYPDRSLPVIRRLINDNDKWVVRMVGVAGHYAVKKGLKRFFVNELFALLMEHADESDYQAIRGIGWAAKTTAKFHPDIVNNYKTRIESDPKVRSWFKSKIDIGLSSSGKYASKYTE